jgi:hypothetical protein
MPNDGATRPDELRSRILQAVRDRPAPTRARAAGPRALLVALAVAAPLAGLALVGGPHVGPRPWSLVLATACGGVALAWATLWAAAGRGGKMLGRPRIWLLWTAVAVPPLWVLWKEVWSAHYDGMSSPWAGRIGLRCFALTLAFALGPLVLLAASRRRSDPTHPVSRGAALGVAAGMYAAVMVDLWCPVGDLRHVLLGHALPVLLLGFVGMWVGNRLLAIRGR